MPFEAEVRIRHALGHWVWMLIRGQVTSTLPDGSPEWFSGVQIDITTQKRQQDALRKSQSLLEKTGEVAGIGGWDLDLVTNSLTWTDQTCRIHGVAPGFQPDLATAIDFYAPDSRPLIRAAVETAISTGAPWDLELQLLTPSGQQVWIRAIGVVDFEGPTPVRLFGAFQDISERLAHQSQLREEHQRMILAKDIGGIGIWEYRPDINQETWDRQMYALYGHPYPSDVPPTDIWRQRVHPEDISKTDEATVRTLRTGERFDSEFRLIWPDGTVRTIRSMADRSGPPGTGCKLIGVNWDVTEARSNERELAEQHRLMQVTLRSIGDAVITTDGYGVVTWLNPVGEMMTGWPLAEARGRPLAQTFNTINESNLLPAESPVDACLAQGAAVGMAADTILISRDGREFGIEDSAAPIKDDNGNIHGAVLVFHDVTTERRLSGEMTYRATHDPLTGTKNRTEFELRLENTLNRSKLDSSHHVLLFIDLDQFKQVNNSCGHSAGDEALQQISKILAGAIRTHDTLARLGGDEFGILLEHCPVSVGQRIAQRICNKLETYRFVRGDKRIRVGASIGLVPLDARWLNGNTAMQAADACCGGLKRRDETAFSTGRKPINRFWPIRGSSIRPAGWNGRWMKTAFYFTCKPSSLWRRKRRAAMARSCCACKRMTAA